MPDQQSQKQRLSELFGPELVTDRISGRGVRVITSCTGLKALTSDTVLVPEDFLKGTEWVSAREQDEETCPAEQMYRGRQHIELLRGVHAARASGAAVTVEVVSAGYGLVAGDQSIAPYDVTCSGLSLREIRKLAAASGLPEAMRFALDQAYDLTLVLLGREYLRACDLPRNTDAPSPVAFVASDPLRSLIPAGQNIRIAALTTEDTRTFKSGFVGLKGAVARAYLENLSGSSSSKQNSGRPLRPGTGNGLAEN